jgi:hypothetical protein
VCRRAKSAAFEDYKFPDPIPEFAEQVSAPLHFSPCFFLPRRSFCSVSFCCGACVSVTHSCGLWCCLCQETSRFREHMMWRLEQKKEDYFGEHVEEIVDVCTEVRIH